MPETASTATDTLRLGVIGTDSSHLAEFTRRIHALADSGDTRCRVTRYWTSGRHQMPTGNVRKWQEQVEGMGVEPSDALESMLDAVDGVLVLSVSGDVHLAEAMPALQRGLPTYIDKPLAADLDSARKILAAARQGSARCYSASSLRFITELESLDRDQLGDLVAIDAYGPGELNDALPHFFYYGVHSVEMVDALWGPGVKQVRAAIGRDRDFIGLRYHDGREAKFRLERKGTYSFGAVVHGTKGVTSFEVDFEPVYSRLVAGMVRFFEGGPAPVDLRDIVENIAVLCAAESSAKQGGSWVDVETIR